MKNKQQFRQKKPTQRETNPFEYSDSNKRYHTFDYYLRSLFGEKVGKVSLDAGFTCPNIDGRCGRGGCIYCLNGSSGAATAETLAEQYEKGREVMRRKWGCRLFIPYLQAHTNTYAPPDVLRRIYKQCASLDGAVMLSVATRADCIDSKVTDVLSEVSEIIPVTVELGLQTVHDATAEKINRCYPVEVFCKSFSMLKGAGGNIKIAVHLINGLPGEDASDMIESAETVGKMHPDVIKLHLLHVLRGTKLFEMYERGEYVPLGMKDYVDIVCRQLERIPGDIAIGRVTGDGKESELEAPLWSLRKTAVANEIDKELYRRGTFQGALCRKD